MTFLRYIGALLLFAVPLCAQQPVTISGVGGQNISLYVTLFNATSATTTQTSSAIRVPGFSGYGTLTAIFSGLTGSPSGCQFALEFEQNTGTSPSSAFFTQAITPSTSYQSFTITPSAGFASGDLIVAVWSCGTTYPTAGTMTVTFAPISAIDGRLGNNGVAASQNRVGTLPCIFRSDFEGGSAATAGRDGAPDCGTDGNLHVAVMPAMRPASYHASKSFAASSTTDNAVLPGNASNTVLVTGIFVSCTETTAGNVTLNIIKRSTADSGGTSASMTAVPDDSNYAAAVSAPLSYTGTGPTVGTAVGNLDTYQLGCMASGTATPNDLYIMPGLQIKPIVLRGTGQQVAVNFNNAAITGGNITVTFAWEEITTITP